MINPPFRLFQSALIITALSAALLSGGAAAQANPAVSSAITVTVQPKDTAYSLAKRAGLSVDALLALNGLSTPDLKIGQVLVVGSSPVHQVEAKETLYSISRKYGVTVDALKAMNTLPENAAIEIGQSLRIPAAGGQPTPVLVTPAAVATTATAEAETAIATPAPEVVTVTAPDPTPLVSGDWRANAMALMGVPYVYGGSSRRGTDCSGFVLQVFTPMGVKLPRTSADQARAGVQIAVGELRPGDLVFFDTAGGGKVTHVGIYLGNDTFANANSYEGKVTINKLISDKYWAPRYLGARRILSDNILANLP